MQLMVSIISKKNIHSIKEKNTNLIICLKVLSIDNGEMVLKANIKFMILKVSIT